MKDYGFTVGGHFFSVPVEGSLDLSAALAHYAPFASATEPQTVGDGTTDCTCGSHDDSPGTCVKLTIDTGLDQRTIVSVIAKYYTPEEMGGKQICILANLQPLTIRGIESKGMILMAKQDEGKMRIVTLEERLSNGAMGRSIFAATTR